MIQTSEYCAVGHPDRTCDFIASTILDAHLEQDPTARVALEVQLKDAICTVSGEVTSTCRFADADIARMCREAVNRIGYTKEYQRVFGVGNCVCGDDLVVTCYLSRQSPDIAQGVDADGWGDQGIFWGLAVDDPACGNMPKDYYLARLVAHSLCDRKFGGLDVKTQVTVEDGVPVECVVAIPIPAGCEEAATGTVRNYVQSILGAKCRVIVNGTGRYVTHGSVGDCGTTGRKLVADFYGGNSRIGGGCVDAATEYLAPDGWHRICDYKGGPVGQVDEDFNLSFVTPKNYIKTWHDEVYEIATQKTLSMVLSGNHNVFYKTSKGNFVKKAASELVSASAKTAKGHHAEIPRFFYFDFANGVSRANVALNRLKVAHCADGTIIHGGSATAKYNGRIRVKKTRKAEALRKILPEAGVVWDERNYKDGYATFYYHLDNTSKLLCEQFVNPDRETAQLLADEVLKWDGSEKYQEYRTTKKRDADFMQFVMSGVSGDSYSICVNRVHSAMRNECYAVRKTKCKYSAPFRKCGLASVEKREAQWMYCFTVDTGLLLLRRRNYVFVTGNSPWGKDPTKADVTLNVLARRRALKFMRENGLDLVQCGISCCIGRSEIRVSFFDAHNNLLATGIEDAPASRIIEELGMRRPTYAETCKRGLFGFE